MYCGAKLWVALKVRSKILYSICFLVGNQWSSINIGVILQEGDNQVRILAAMCIFFGGGEFENLEGRRDCNSHSQAWR